MPRLYSNDSLQNGLNTFSANKLQQVAESSGKGIKKLIRISVNLIDTWRLLHMSRAREGDYLLQM